jgi:hypothetical protein
MMKAARSQRVNNPSVLFVARLQPRVRGATLAKGRLAEAAPGRVPGAAPRQGSSPRPATPPPSAAPFPPTEPAARAKPAARSRAASAASSSTAAKPLRSPPGRAGHRAARRSRRFRATAVVALWTSGAPQAMASSTGRPKPS